jgi:PAS domain S-box-containing protein
LPQFKETLNRIREVLKDQPRGLTITEISSCIDLNRNSTARYLDVLLISGQVEMKSVGAAKLYFLSPRLPVEAVLDMSEEGVLMLNSGLHVIRVNDTFARLVSRKAQDLMGASITRHKIGFLFDEMVVSSIREAIDGKQVSFETQVEVDGQTCYLQVRFVPTTFDDGDAGVTIITEDIAARRNAEAELKRQSNFLNLVMESVAHPFYVIDANDYSIKMANKAARLGTLTANSTCYALTHQSSTPCSGKVHPCPLKEVKAAGRPVVVEHTHHHVSGRTRHLEIHAHPIFGDEGEVSQMIEYNLDITERKEIEDDLRRQVELLSSILDSLSEVKIVVQQNHIVFANRSFSELVNISPADLIGSELKRFIKPREWNILRNNMDSGDTRGEITLLNTDNTSSRVAVSVTRIQYNKKPAELCTLSKIK